jgi:hypothetical protein
MQLAFCPTFLWPLSLPLASGEARLPVCFSMAQSLGHHYIRYINQSCERTGTLWEGRNIELRHQLL